MVYLVTNVKHVGFMRNGRDLFDGRSPFEHRHALSWSIYRSREKKGLSRFVLAGCTYPTISTLPNSF